MMIELTLQELGGAVAVVFPPEMAARFGLVGNNRAWLIETEHGILVVPHESDVTEATRLARETAARFRGALRALRD